MTHRFRLSAPDRRARCAARSARRDAAVVADAGAKARTEGGVRGAMMTAATFVGAMAAAALLLAGCASPGGPVDHRALMTPQTLTQTSANATDWPARDWWTAWRDPQLSALIDRALADQPSLQTVQSRLVQAQAAVDASGALRAPQVNGTLSAVDQRFSATSIYPPPYGGSVNWVADGQIAASWELDVFGQQRAEIRSAIGLARAGEAEAQAARVLLAGNVVVAYVNLARLAQTRAITQQAIEQRTQVLDLVRARTGAGLDSKIDLRQAEGSVAQARLELQGIDETMGRSRHALAELTAQQPLALDGLLPQMAAVHSMLPADGAIPADLVGRRADLAAQRWRVEAALKQVDVARAQFYPNINLSAFVGLSSIGLGNFAKTDSRVYGTGPALRLPIFEGGRLRANLAGRNAEVDAAIDAYNTTLLRALREVADELTSLGSLDQQQATQVDAARAAEGAYDLALQRYRAGLGNFLVVLTAQTDVLTQRRAGAELQARRLNSEAALARALGGGYAGELGVPPPVPVATAALTTTAASPR